MSVAAHRLRYGIWIENWPSSTLAFPVVGVTGCRECMLLKGIIRAKCGDALKSCTNSFRQMRETDDLSEQFFGNYLLLCRVQRCVAMAGPTLPQVVKGPNSQNIGDRAYGEIFFPREVPQRTIRQCAKQVGTVKASRDYQRSPGVAAANIPPLPVQLFRPVAREICHFLVESDDALLLQLVHWKS